MPKQKKMNEKKNTQQRRQLNDGETKKLPYLYYSVHIYTSELDERIWCAVAFERIAYDWVTEHE